MMHRCYIRNFEKFASCLVIMYYDEMKLTISELIIGNRQKKKTIKTVKAEL